MEFYLAHGFADLEVQESGVVSLASGEGLAISTHAKFF
jgi:hypothetical protein